MTVAKRKERKLKDGDLVCVWGMRGGGGNSGEVAIKRPKVQKGAEKVK